MFEERWLIFLSIRYMCWKLCGQKYLKVKFRFSPWFPCAELFAISQTKRAIFYLSQKYRQHCHLSIYWYFDCLRGLWLSIRRQVPNNYSDTVRRGALSTKISHNFEILSVITRYIPRQFIFYQKWPHKLAADSCLSFI